MGWADFTNDNKDFQADKNGLYPAGENISFNIDSVEEKEFDGKFALIFRLADAAGETVDCFCNMGNKWGKRTAAEVFAACGFDSWPAAPTDVVGSNILADIVHNNGYVNVRNIGPGGESNMSSSVPF